MPTPPDLRWIASVSASTFHVAAALRDASLPVDPRLAATMAEPVELLIKEIKSCGLPAERTLDLLAALSMGIENNTELATVAITKVAGRNESTDEKARVIAGRISDLEANLRNAKPNIVDELALRGEPLKAQWEARGPGMMSQIARLTDERLRVERADVALVLPAVGGHGVAHLPFNSVRIEAVLANPVTELPEVVRLAWLLAQLQCDLPIFAEHIGRDRLPRIAALAMIPPVLAAAQSVELVRDGAAMLPRALFAWRLADESDAKRLAGVMATWWETYLDASLSWAAALGGLEQMVDA